jgi:sorbitol/mannitol transport system permease protein
MPSQPTFTPAYLMRTAAAWAVALLLFFPLGWLLLTAFKTELQAIAVPPELFFSPTLENFHEVQERSDYLHYAWNSVVTIISPDKHLHNKSHYIIPQRALLILRGSARMALQLKF